MGEGVLIAVAALDTSVRFIEIKIVSNMKIFKARMNSSNSYLNKEMNSHNVLRSVFSSLITTVRTL